MKIKTEDSKVHYNMLPDSWRSLGNQTISLKIWSKRKTPNEHRWTKQQTRSSGPNQLSRINSFKSVPSESLTPDPPT